MVEGFDVQRVSLGGPIFMLENPPSEPMDPGTDSGQLLDHLSAWKNDRQTLEEVAAAIQPRINLLSEAGKLGRFLF